MAKPKLEITDVHFRFIKKLLMVQVTYFKFSRSKLSRTSITVENFFPISVPVCNWLYSFTEDFESWEITDNKLSHQILISKN